MKKRVKIGKYKTVFKGEIFTVLQAPAIFPGGRKATFERVCRDASVIILALDDKSRLLLIREYRIARKRYEWFLPAGRADKPGETPLMAAKREFREETKLIAKNMKLFYRTGWGNSLRWEKYYYIATNLKPDPHPLAGDEDQDITIVPTLLSKAYKMALRGDIHKDDLAYSIIRLYQTRQKWLAQTSH